MILFPNCKINIGLRVVRKREDGYHDLQTIFYPVMGLHDELEVLPLHNATPPLHNATQPLHNSTQPLHNSTQPLHNSTQPLHNSTQFIQEGLAVDCPAEDNLIIKCYRHMRAKYPQIGDVRIRFKKNIPFGAGLGGGSSDAAHMAIALNELFALGLSKEQLAAEVRVLGADCPFFVYNTPCYAEGIGDILTPIPLDLSGLRLIMIKPHCGVSTREAYAGIRLSDGSDLSNVSDLSALLSRAVNDFEQTVFPLHPEIGVIKQRLLDAGAVYAAMSGSGSTVFGLFTTPSTTLPNTAQHDAERSADTHLRMLHEEFASMIIFDDTL